jgi:aryl-alcohol dehydrogenase-like predicted oxidoreductase
MKAQASADRHGWPRLVAHQVYYSLIGRAYEADLMPLGADQGVGALVWSPLGWGRLTGKIGRGSPGAGGQPPARYRAVRPAGRDRTLYRVIDALEAIAAETGKSVPQVAINWLLRRPTVSSVIIGARNEEQLRQNLGAVGWALTVEQVAMLDAASDVLPPYPHTPYRQQEGFARLNPPLV